MRLASHNQRRRRPRPADAAGSDTPSPAPQCAAEARLACEGRPPSITSHLDFPTSGSAAASVTAVRASHSSASGSEFSPEPPAAADCLDLDAILDQLATDPEMQTVLQSFQGLGSCFDPAGHGGAAARALPASCPGAPPPPPPALPLSPRATAELPDSLFDSVLDLNMDLDGLLPHLGEAPPPPAPPPPPPPLVPLPARAGTSLAAALDMLRAPPPPPPPLSHSLVRVSLKLFNVTPDQLGQALREQLERVLGLEEEVRARGMFVVWIMGVGMLLGAGGVARA
jgi:hypothetical protein